MNSLKSQLREPTSLGARTVNFYLACWVNCLEPKEAQRIATHSSNECPVLPVEVIEVMYMAWDLDANKPITEDMEPTIEEMRKEWRELQMSFKD